MTDVDYSKIIKNSWNITKNNKWLWVPGLVLAVFSGGSSYRSFNSGSRSSSSSFPSASPSPNNIENIKSQASNVLGAATDSIKSWFLNISPMGWFLLVVVVLVSVLFFMIFRWVLVSWAKAALISGFEDAELGKSVNLKTMSPKGIAKIKALIWYAFVSFGIVLLALAALATIMGVGFLLRALIPILGNIWLVLFGIVGTLALIIFLFIFSMQTVYAERLIVLKNFEPFNAWKTAFKLTKGNFLPTVIVGIINGVLGCFAGCGTLIAVLLVLALPGYLLIAPIFDNGFHMPGIGQVVGLIILFVILVTVNTLVKALIVVFDCGNWNQVFKQIFSDQKTDNEK
jgi:hypothetical protein